MPARQLRLHTPFLKTFLNDLQFLFIRPMTTPGFGVGNGLLAGGGFVAAHDCNRYKISHHPKRRHSPEAYGLLRPCRAYGGCVTVPHRSQQKDVCSGVSAASNCEGAGPDESPASVRGPGERDAAAPG